MTPQDVANKLRMDYRRVLTLCVRGVIPCINLKLLDADRKNNCYRIDPKELDQWIESLRVKQSEKKTGRKKGRYDDMSEVPSVD